MFLFIHTHTTKHYTKQTNKKQTTVTTVGGVVLGLSVAGL